MSLHAGQEKKLRRQIIIAKVTLERTLCNNLLTQDEPGDVEVGVVGEVGGKLQRSLKCTFRVVLQLEVLVDTVIGA